MASWRPPKGSRGCRGGRSQNGHLDVLELLLEHDAGRNRVHKQLPLPSRWDRQGLNTEGWFLVSQIYHPSTGM